MASDYAFNPEEGSETARLINLDRLITKGMGGTLAGAPDLPKAAAILDIGCGPGGWVLEVAFEHPAMEVAGIDISQAMIKYANARAQTQHLTNATFGVMDFRQPLDFNDESFDLVNARLLAAGMKRENWGKLVQECYRITRPGGFIRLTETDFIGLTNSPAFAAMCQKAYLPGYKLGYNFSPDGSSIGITYMLGTLLRQGGFTPIKTQAHVIDISWETEAWTDFYHNVEIAFKQLQPLLVQAGLGTEQELEQLYQQVLLEMLRNDFRGVWPYMSVWGRKPQ